MVVGETAVGRRQYIPITGGTVAGPKFKGEIIRWLGLPACEQRWLRHDQCGLFLARRGWHGHPHPQPGAELSGQFTEAGRNYLRPQFEAPIGPHEWMTRATFVATLELDPSPAAQGRTTDAWRHPHQVLPGEVNMGMKLIPH